MTLAEPAIMKCPQCGTMMLERRLRSGNTLGARRWSDGKVKAQMFPKVTSIIKCSGCNGYYLSCSDNELANVNDIPDKESMPYTKHLSFDELIEAKPYVYDGNELLWFIELWHSYNDMLLDRNKWVSFPHMESFIDNANEILSLDVFKEKGLSGVILEAELNRELGDFDKCIQLLKNHQEDKQYKLIIEQIVDAAQRQNDIVLELK